MDVMDTVHVVSEFCIGNTRIKIADDYCREKTPKDVEKILQRIAIKAKEHLNSVIVEKN